MNHYFIHQSRWFFSLFLLFSLHVMATTCEHCGKEKEPAADGQTLCRTCDSGKLTSLPFSPSPHSTWVAEDKKDEQNNDTFVKSPALEFFQNLLDLADNLLMKKKEQHTQPEMDDQQQKQLEILEKLQQAQLSAGADQAKKTLIHVKTGSLTRQRTAQIGQSQWSTDLFHMGLLYLSSAEFNHSQMMMALAPVFDAIQTGNTVQLIITTVVTDGGDQATAGTVTPVIMGAIIPDPTTNSPTDMHLIMGTAPVHVNQDNLIEILTATMTALSENMDNAHLSLHFFMSLDVYL